MKVGKKMYSIYGKDFGPKKKYFDNDASTKLIKLFIVITEINHLVKKEKERENQTLLSLTLGVGIKYGKPKT